MAFSTAHLRRWFAVAAGVLCLLVAGVYFHARRHVQNALKQVPEKLNLQIQQSAEGFTISKSEQGRTLFKLQASKAVQFKSSGRAELHDVMITIYGRDSSRFDQVYGKSFEYDQQTGNVTSQGDVSIDLQSNPGGVSNPDQATPLELKNPIHLKTTNLVFNQKTGDAWTSSLVEFHVPQLSGTAVGAKYDSKENMLTLSSQVQMSVAGIRPLSIRAQRAVLEKNPREILLDQPQTESSRGRGRANEARLFLREDDTLDHAIATGNVAVDSIADSHQRNPGSTLHVTARELQVAMGVRNRPETAVFSGDVRLRSEGTQISDGSAGRVELRFGSRNAVTDVRASEEVKLWQHGEPVGSNSQDVEVTAPNIDFLLANGNRLTKAETTGPPQIRIMPAAGKAGPETRITADRFTAKFDSLGQLSEVHGGDHARVVSSAPPSHGNAPPDRVSTSDTIDAHFRPGTGVETLSQQGHFAYRSGTQQAFGKSARYTPADQLLAVFGSPRFVDSGMETSANVMSFNRSTGEARATGDVKTSYSDLKQQPDGALLASSDPIHVTAATMTATSSPQIATYTGNVRLWQDANLVQAPRIQFTKDQRSIVADSITQQKVSTTLISTDKHGKTMPVHVTSDHLTYEDANREAHFQGAVVAQGADMTLTSQQMDVFFAQSGNAEQATGARTSSPVQTGTAAAKTASTPQAKLERIVATGSVLMTQPNRHAEGDKLTYTASDDKFVLTGGPPSIFDAERGKITGVSLTLYRTDDRVIVDGNSSSPAVTETRVER